jgi:hypothetical protein
MPEGRWNQAVINSEEELEPVNDILRITQSVVRIAQRAVDRSEAEYQRLRNTEWTDDTPQGRRFYWLRWEREALANFIAQAGAAAANLEAETQNVWNAAELAAVEAQEAREGDISEDLGTDESD